MGLTTLFIIHTAISLVALCCGFYAPLAASTEASVLKGIYAVLLVVFLVVLTLQLRWTRASSRR